jgi:hypothetical protein
MKKKIALPVFLLCLLLSACSVKKINYASAYRYSEPTLKQTLLGEWELTKVVYYDRFEDRDQDRAFDFQLNNFFTVKCQEGDSTTSKTNLFEAAGNVIKLINMNNFKVFEVMEVVKCDKENIILKSTYPEDLGQTIYASRVHTSNYVYHED